MTWFFHIANVHRQLDGYVELIQTSIGDAKQRAERITEPVTLDVIIQVCPGRVIEEVGHVGYAPTSSMIQLTFDPANPNFQTNLGERLSRSVAHELHHCLRWDGPGYGTTVGETLISEGLACLFPHQLYGHEPESWEHLAPDWDMADLVERAQAEWREPIDSHISWFRGGDGLAIPSCVFGWHMDRR